MGIKQEAYLVAIGFQCRSTEVLIFLPGSHDIAGIILASMTQATVKIEVSQYSKPLCELQATPTSQDWVKGDLSSLQKVLFKASNKQDHALFRGLCSLVLLEIQ